MKRKLVFVFLLLVLLIIPQIVLAQESFPDRTVNFFKGIYSDIESRSLEQNVEGVGLWILKVQETIAGATKFLSLGIYNDGTNRGIMPFLIFSLFFMTVYALLSWNSKTSGLSLIISTLVGIIGVRYLDSSSIQVILASYAALGMLSTIIIPSVIILAFSYSVYHKAHKGNNETSPFYANLFNLFFLGFFGIFFFRYSFVQTAGPAMAAALKITGVIYLVFAVLQFFVFKLIAQAIDKEKVSKIKEIAKDKEIRARVFSRYKNLLRSSNLQS